MNASPFFLPTDITGCLALKGRGALAKEEEEVGGTVGTVGTVSSFSSSSWGGGRVLDRLFVLLRLESGVGWKRSLAGAAGAVGVAAGAGAAGATAAGVGMEGRGRRRIFTF